MTRILEAWFSAVEAMDESEFIDLEYLSNLSLRERVPITWCVDTRDVHEVRSFVPAYLLANQALWNFATNLGKSQMICDAEKW